MGTFDGYIRDEMGYDRIYPPVSSNVAIENPISNGWLTYPPEKYEFVRVDHQPNYWGK
jgi:hypothetical protein